MQRNKANITSTFHLQPPLHLRRTSIDSPAIKANENTLRLILLIPNHPTRPTAPTKSQPTTRRLLYLSIHSPAEQTVRSVHTSRITVRANLDPFLDLVDADVGLWGSSARVWSLGSSALRGGVCDAGCARAGGITGGCTKGGRSVAEMLLGGRLSAVLCGLLRALVRRHSFGGRVGWVELFVGQRRKSWWETVVMCLGDWGERLEEVKERRTCEI